MTADLTVVSLSTTCWGAEQSLLTLLARIPGRARVAAPSGELLDRAAADGHAVLRITDPSVLRLRELGISVGAAGSAMATAAAVPSLVRLPLWGAGPVVSFSMWLHLPLALAGRARRHPVVLDLHDGPFTPAGAAVQSAAAFAAHRSVSVSRTALDHVGRWPHRRIAVVPRPVDVPDELAGRRPAREPVGPFRTVIVGRIDPEKRVEVALEAQRTLVGEGRPITLEVIGAPLRGSVTLDELRAQWPDAVFSGRLPHDEVLRRVASADVLLSTAPGEAFGRTVAEASLLGVPSVVLGGGPAEIVRDGRTGFVVPGQDARSLAGVLRGLLDRRAELGVMGEAARSDVAEQCDPATVAVDWWEAVSR